MNGLRSSVCDRMRARMAAAADCAVAIGISALAILIEPRADRAPVKPAADVWTKDMPEPPSGVDVLLDADDTGEVRYLCRRSPNSFWFWVRDPCDITKCSGQTGMAWKFAASQARGPLVVVRP